MGKEMVAECCEYTDSKLCFQTSIWFRGLYKRDFATGIGGFKHGLLALKVIFAAYWTSMWIFTMVQLDKRAYSNETSPFYGKKYTDFLTNWNDTIILMYLLYSLIIVATNYGWKSLSEKAPWYYYIVQLGQEIALVTAVFVTFFFWFLLGKTHEFALYIKLPESIHAHAMNTVVMCLDFFLTAIPFRALHVVYIWATACIYMLNTYIVAQIDTERDRIYPFLVWTTSKERLMRGDWTDNLDMTTAQYCCLFIFLGVTIVFYILYGLSCLKFYILNKTGLNTKPLVKTSKL